MAVETTDYRAVLRFLRESLALPCELDTAGTRQPHQDQPLAEYRVFVAGWPELEGVMLLKPAMAPAELCVTLAARSERALRDLLRAFPAGEAGRFSLAADWMRAALAEFFELEALALPAGPSSASHGHSWRGIKRGVAADLLSPPPAPQGGVRSKVGPDANAPAEISGAKDPLLAQLRALGQPSGRRAHSRYLVEGERLALRAILDGLPVEICVFTPELERTPGGAGVLQAAKERRIRTIRASAGLMGKITTTRPLPPVLAAVFAAFRDAAQFRTHPGTTLLVTEAVNNPENLGMVLRTADAAGVEGVVVLGEQSDPYHKLCGRAARGAVGRVPILSCAAPLPYLQRLRVEGFRILGATAHAEASLYEVELRPPLVVVVGNEQDGITPALLAACTERVRIPMAPGQSSLNVGVATGVLLFELVRQRLAPP